jgi:hypothetical protein
MRPGGLVLWGKFWHAYDVVNLLLATKAIDGARPARCDHQSMDQARRLVARLNGDR